MVWSHKNTAYARLKTTQAAKKTRQKKHNNKTAPRACFTKYGVNESYTNGTGQRHYPNSLVLSYWYCDRNTRYSVRYNLLSCICLSVVYTHRNPRSFQSAGPGRLGDIHPTAPQPPGDFNLTPPPPPSPHSSVSSVTGEELLARVTNRKERGHQCTHPHKMTNTGRTRTTLWTFLVFFRVQGQQHRGHAGRWD